MRSLTVGAAPDNDIVIEDARISGRHARLTARPDGGWLLEDLQSRNGTRLNGKALGRSEPAYAGDVVGLGGRELTLEALLQLAKSTDPHRTGDIRQVPLSQTLTTIGRDPKSHVQIADPAVTAHHARVVRSAGRMVLEDLGSRHGTYVFRDGAWESYRTLVLRHDDLVRVGGTVLRFVPPPPTQAKGARLDVDALTLTVPHRATGNPVTLVNHVSFSALGGEIVGIMGPSGSGKTTLLNMLAGFDRPTSGDIRLGGLSVIQAGGGAAFAAYVGHAPQFDVAHALLTVAETVRASARLRGPAHWTDAEIDQRVDQALRDVDLHSRRDTPMGSETRKSLSGGQKKRVNIAMELVLDPPILLLDEPTSGLSAHDTLDLMVLLRRLSDRGRTIVLTIHQPSYQAFVQMDHVLVLEEGGHVAWYGPAASDSFEWFDVTDRDPGGLLEQLGKKADPQVPGPYAQRYAGSEAREAFVQARLKLPADRSALGGDRRAPSAGAQWATLLARALRLKLRDRFFLVLAILVPALVSAMFVAVLEAGLDEPETWSFESAAVEHRYLMVLTIMVCFFGALSASLDVVSERDILRRELRGGLSLGAYVASKAALVAVPSLIFPVVAVGTIKLLASDVFEPEAWPMIMVLIPAFFAAACAGLLLSALVTSADGVIILAVAYVIVQVVFSIFANLDVADSEREGWMQVASAPITARWTLAGLVTISDLCVEDRPVAPARADSDEDGAKRRTRKGQGDADAGEDRLATSAPEAAGQDAFLENWNQTQCQMNHYRAHGVRPALVTADRTRSEVRHRAVLWNLLLAVGALMAAGLVLARRGTRTQ